MNISNKIFFDKDISIKPILGKKVGVVGYGSQGRAQALNLRDSKVDIVKKAYFFPSLFDLSFISKIDPTILALLISELLIIS